MSSNDVAWREYNIHEDYGTSNNDDEAAQQQEQGGDYDHDDNDQDSSSSDDCNQPVDIFAPREEDTYETHQYNFDIINDSDGADVSGSSNSITIHLRSQSDYDVSTGMSVWKGSEILCNYLSQHRHSHVRNKRILELGAGVGLCGLVCGIALGASSVVLTDGDSVVLRNLRYNAQANGLLLDNVDEDDNGNNANNENKCKVSCPQLIWGKSRAQPFQQQYGLHDVILATDCVYVTKSVRPLFETIQTLLAPGGVFLFVNSCASICSLEEVMKIGKEEFGLVALEEEIWRMEGNEEDPVYVFRRR